MVRSFRLGAFIFVVALTCCGAPAPKTLHVGPYTIANPQRRSLNPEGLLLRAWRRDNRYHMGHAPSRRDPVLCSLEVFDGVQETVDQILERQLSALPATSHKRAVIWPHAAGRLEGVALTIPVRQDYLAVGVTTGTFRVRVFGLMQSRGAHTHDIAVLSVGSFSQDPQSQKRANACRHLLKTVRYDVSSSGKHSE